MKKIIPTCLILVLTYLIPLYSAAGTMVVIINANNPITKLTKAEVKEYFLKKKTRWKTGKKVRSTDNQSNDSMRNSFNEKVLVFSGVELERYWLEQQYQKAQKPPTTLSSDTEALKFVGKFKGAIGFVDQSSVKGNSSVKTVFSVNY
ncbi:MAG: hypothetical protein KUG79_07260 [Pseudomonadales bacterium]|nr:hypothetical protein [Pseudomonadales bacterium]